METVFLEIGLIFLVAVVVSGVMSKLKQPLIIGYIITGLLVGPYFFNVLHSEQTLEVFSSIGVALLLFIIGLSLNPRVVKEVGKVSLITGIGQVVVTTIVGYGIGLLLGFSQVQALYVAVALTFSSTIIILKLLSDKRELNRLYGKIATGFLLVQDIVAALILIGMVTVSKGGNLASSLVRTLVISCIAIAVFLLFNKYLMPRLGKLFASSQEYLFLFAIGWGFGIAALFAYIGLSVEIGALFAGVVLASSPYSLEISSKLKPLRDFFLVIFFVLLGAQLQPSGITEVLLPSLILSAFILIGNPLIVMSLMGLLGYQSKTSFKAGLTVAQISEFSLILIVLANSLKQVDTQAVSLVTIVGIITIAVSTYFIIYSDAIYAKIAPYLGIFEKKKKKKDVIEKESYDVILFGFRTIGKRFIKNLLKRDQKLLVVDYDPEVIEQLDSLRITNKYGDAGNIELLDEIELKKSKLIISTITDLNTNLLILKEAKNTKHKNAVVVTSDEIDEAQLLYDAGANYVMMPHYIGTMRTGEMIEGKDFDLSVFIKEKEKHLNYLASITDYE